MGSRTASKLLKAAGQHDVAVKGSHLHFKHPAHPGRVTVIHPSRDFTVRTPISTET